MLTNPKKVIFSLLLINISGCSSTQLVDFSVIKESIQCQEPEAKLAILKSEKEQNRYIENFSLFKLPETPHDLKKLFSEHNSTENLFIVSLGQKTTSGYGFSMEGDKGLLAHNTLTLPIRFTSPEPGSMQASLMTSPCLILGIDSKAQFKQLVIDKLQLTITN